MNLELNMSKLGKYGLQLFELRRHAASWHELKASWKRASQSFTMLLHYLCKTILCRPELGHQPHFNRFEACTHLEAHVDVKTIVLHITSWWSIRISIQHVHSDAGHRRTSHCSHHAVGWFFRAVARWHTPSSWHRTILSKGFKGQVFCWELSYLSWTCPIILCAMYGLKYGLTLTCFNMF